MACFYKNISKSNFFAGTKILIEGVFVIHLSSNEGISVWWIVCVITDCSFMSGIFVLLYKVVQIWPRQTVTCLHTVVIFEPPCICDFFLLQKVTENLHYLLVCLMFMKFLLQCFMCTICTGNWHWLSQLVPRTTVYPTYFHKTQHIKCLWNFIMCINFSCVHCYSCL
jgi:hypothetical protein